MVATYHILFVYAYLYNMSSELLFKPYNSMCGEFLHVLL